MKTAKVLLDEKSGFWAIFDVDTGRAILRICDTELEAYKIANANGYLVQ